ncbi:unnamed protein product [Rotaria sp. Silwood1]|nr:unnamed protein product [Rotaria sp. Silwood1]
MITSVRQLPLLDIPDLDQVNWTSSVGSDNNGNVRLSINLNDNQNITNPTTTQSIKLNLESIPTAESVEAQGLSTFWKIVLSMITVTVLVVEEQLQQRRQLPVPHQLQQLQQLVRVPQQRQQLPRQQRQQQLRQLQQRQPQPQQQLQRRLQQLRQLRRRQQQPQQQLQRRLQQLLQLQRPLPLPRQQRQQRRQQQQVRPAQARPQQLQPAQQRQRQLPLPQQAKLQLPRQLQLQPPRQRQLQRQRQRQQQLPQQVKLQQQRRQQRQHQPPPLARPRLQVTSASCATGYTRTPSGTCVNLLIDFNNCGSIGYVCASTYTSCSYGACSGAPAVQLTGAVTIPGWDGTVNVDDAYVTVSLPFSISLYGYYTSSASVQSNGLRISETRIHINMLSFES